MRSAMNLEMSAVMRGTFVIVVASTLGACVGPPRVASPSREEHAGIGGGSGLQLGPARATMVPQITVVYRTFTYGGHSIREQSDGARKTISPTNGGFLIVETEVRRDRSRRDGRGFQFGTDTSVLTDHAGNTYPACGVCTMGAEGYERMCTTTTGKPSDIPDEGWTCILYFDVPKGIRPRAIRLTPGTPAVEVNGARQEEETSAITSSLLAFSVGTGEPLRFTDGDVVWNVGPRILAVQEINLRTGEGAVSRDGKLEKATARLVPQINHRKGGEEI